MNEGGVYLCLTRYAPPSVIDGGVTMLERVDFNRTGGDVAPYLDFSRIVRFSSGTGRCFVYEVVMKNTKAGKPFVTLYLRDVNGLSIPGYIFNLKSPLLAGEEAAKVKGLIVEVDWRENYLDNVGLTLILDKVSVVPGLGASEYSKFTGAVADVEILRSEIESFIQSEIGVNITLPFGLTSSSYMEYAQGRVGGLCKHYSDMAKMLPTFKYLGQAEYRHLISTFVIFIFVHSNVVRAESEGRADITLVTELNSRVSKLATSLECGAGAMELINMCFGYTPKDVYVRNIKALSDFVHRVEKEFSLYRTIPLSQEGNVGYGEIKRYIVET